jgi:chromatin remodeling complex protein RSC6
MAKKKKTTVKKAPAKKKAVVKKAAIKKTVAKKTKAKKSAPRKASGLNQMTYALSPELQAIVGNKKLTRPQIVKGLWTYIKDKKCQDAKNKRMIVPDDKLSEVLGKKPVDMLKIAGLLNKHILS